EYDAELPQVPAFLRIRDPREGVRSRRDSHQEIAEQRRQVQRAEEHDHDHGARQQYQHQLERPAHLEVLVLPASDRKIAESVWYTPRPIIKGATRADQQVSMR